MEKQVRYVSAYEVHEYMNKKWNLIDIRSTSEYTKEHVPHSRNVPFRGNDKFIYEIEAKFCVGVIIVSEEGYYDDKDATEAAEAIMDKNIGCVVVMGGYSVLSNMPIISTKRKSSGKRKRGME